MAETPKHEPLIERFQADLKTLPSQDLVRKHITTGMPTELSDEDYFELRRIVAEEFELHPGNIVLIGSCRQGFSIVPKKRWRPARASSDLDVAIVSAERFDGYWESVFTYSRTNAAWSRSKRYRTFARNLFSGWIDPRGLPPVPRFAEAARWSEFFDSIMESRRFGPRRISARLYRTWSRLDAYQERAVLKCLKALGA
jgi:hypothetical protein